MSVSAASVDYSQWPDPDRLRLLAIKQSETWLADARNEQLPPKGEWRTWYLMGGRGSGKSWTGAQQLADWEGKHEPGVYGILAPVFADAVKKCVEETLLDILGSRVSHWNRGNGELYLKSGSQFYCDGANDGAERIQGFNLRGAWADEVGLWAQAQWENAWFFTLLPAVRLDPGKIVATGTPKMGHPLVRLLVEDPKVPVSHMHTRDNIGNLSRETIESLYEQFPEGTLRHRQELEGEWVAAIEGDLLKRAWWRYYEPQKRTESFQTFSARLPKFGMILVSVDTPLKDKESSDNVAIQVWGVDKANTYLLDTRVDKMSYDQCRRSVIELSRWARSHWRTCQHRTIIENAGYGAELLIDLKREIGLIDKGQPNVEGTKGSRAEAASGYLQTGNCFLPGRIKDDLSGPDERVCPKSTMSLVNEAAMFQLDGSHGSHDDQVDAWSQAMNYLRRRQSGRARGYSAFKIKKR